jgi:hypothetical protein
MTSVTRMVGTADGIVRRAAAQSSQQIQTLRTQAAEGRKVADDLRGRLKAGRKAHAQGTVDRLKHQMQELSKLAIANPKGAARLLKAMSQQLARAAKDYAAMGPDATGGGAAAPADAEVTSDRQTLAATWRSVAGGIGPSASDAQFLRDADALRHSIRAFFESLEKKVDDEGERRSLDREQHETDAQIGQALRSIRGWNGAGLGGGVSILV